MERHVAHSPVDILRMHEYLDETMFIQITSTFPTKPRENTDFQIEKSVLSVERWIVVATFRLCLQCAHKHQLFTQEQLLIFINEQRAL